MRLHGEDSSNYYLLSVSTHREKTIRDPSEFLTVFLREKRTCPISPISKCRATGSLAEVLPANHTHLEFAGHI